MEIQEKIMEVMAKYVTPILQSHGGDAKFVNFNEKTGELAVKLIGSCGSCPFAKETLRMTVETAIKKYVPEVKSVIQA